MQIRQTRDYSVYWKYFFNNLKKDTYLRGFAVADPGFSKGMPTLRRGALGYDFIKISRKLHEIENNMVTRSIALIGTNFKLGVLVLLFS